MTHYNGRLCPRHPEAFGMRYIKGDDCLPCTRERTIMRRKKPPKSPKGPCINCEKEARYQRGLYCYQCYKDKQEAQKFSPASYSWLVRNRSEAHKKLDALPYEDVIIDNWDRIVFKTGEIHAAQE